MCALACASISAFADGPADRRPTDPRTITSATQGGAAALSVEALLTSSHTYGFAHSNDGRRLAYISDASGRSNLWIMNADGTGARQLIQSNDRQTSARFTHDDAQVVYSQDRGGNEYYNIYVVPVSGEEPRNLTNTADVTETVREFSPDGKLLAIGIKQKIAPASTLAGEPLGILHPITQCGRRSSIADNAASQEGRSSETKSAPASRNTSSAWDSSALFSTSGR